MQASNRWFRLRARACPQPGSEASSGGRVILDQGTSDANDDLAIAIFTLLINGVEVSRSRNVFFRKADVLFLNGVQPVSAGQVDVECQVKIMNISQNDHKFHLSFGNHLLNFKFKKR